MKNIKAIIFDAYGTLFDVNSATERSKDKIGDKWKLLKLKKLAALKFWK